MASFVFTGFSTTTQILNNGQSGFVGQEAELIVSTGPAIDGDGTNYVTLNGSVVTQDGGWSVYDFDGTVMNLFIGQHGMVNATNSDTISANATTAMRVSNAGTIFSGEDALDLRASDTEASIRVNNTGDIFALSDGMVTSSGTSTTLIFNSGTISAQSGYGVYAVSGAGGLIRIHNTGVIEGDTGSLYLIADNNTASRVINSGTLIGDVRMGNAADIYNGTAGNLLDGGIYANGGNDTLRGGGSDETFYGGGENDWMSGRGGDDTLTGGSGTDTLTGGAGADTFVYATITDSPSASGDVIRDFTRGEDVIDLGAFAGTLQFRGTQNYSLGTPGVKYFVDSAGSALVFIDTNGDAVTDMRITLRNVSALSADDFIL